jgi:hypothetical protein
MLNHRHCVAFRQYASGHVWRDHPDRPAKGGADPINICQRCTATSLLAARLRPDSGGSGRGEEPARNAGAGRRALDEMNADWSDEETNDPLVAECAQFLQGREMDAPQHESRWLAGNNLDQAGDVFMKAIKRRPIQGSQCGASPVVAAYAQASRGLASVLG